MKNSGTALFWFRRDLRLADNPGLSDALSKYEKVITVFVHDSNKRDTWSIGGASKSWLHHSLKSLTTDISKLGGHLVIREGESFEVLKKLIEETGASALFWNRRYEPCSMATDTLIKQTLKGTGINVVSHVGNLLAEPWEIANQSGKPFQVFSPFWKHHLRSIKTRNALSAPTKLPAVNNNLKSAEIEDLTLLPRLGWDKGFYQRSQPGESGAQIALEDFLESSLHHYKTGRNFPASKGTSKLSPHLSFGEISPVQILEAVSEYSHAGKNYDHFLSEVGWREFAYHLLFHFPHTTENPLKSNFREFPWEEDSVRLEAWKRGRTGIPIIDAGMRELWTTGWMHNRVRMIAGSFLVKNLLIPWQEGAKWFWDTLVDADLASNTLGWQWVAGSGADAAPYFRIFNPVLQSKKFDAHGEYIRSWVPELAGVPDDRIHTPWESPELLSETGYPEKITSLTESRNRALEAYKSIKV